MSAWIPRTGVGDPEARWLTPDQVARRCAVCTETVYRWIRDRKLAARRLPGGNLRVPEEALASLGEPETSRRKTTMDYNRLHPRS